MCSLGVRPGKVLGNIGVEYVYGFMAYTVAKK